MLVAHHIVDALRGKSSRFKIAPLRSLILPESTRERYAFAIAAAEKFDFGNLVFERATPDEVKDFDTDDYTRAIAEDMVATGGELPFKLPALQEAEREAWAAGLLPLPAPVCWFEYTLGANRAGILVTTDLDQQVWSFSPIDTMGSEVFLDGFSSKIERTELSPGKFKLSFYSDDAVYQMNARPSERVMSALQMRTTNAAFLALYLNLMLYSRSTVRSESERPSEKLNKKRARQNRSPLAAHHIVRIVPEKYLRESREEATGTHRSPRLHWRRTHLRHYPHHTPGSQWAPTIEHKGVKGWWVAVIARMLVGRAELGEVSHEYRVG